MLWNGFKRKKIIDAGARYRAQHSAFLTFALRTTRRIPRIPRKRADQGGYSGLLKLETGERHAAQWWSLAMMRLDELETPDPTNDPRPSRRAG